MSDDRTYVKLPGDFMERDILDKDGKPLSPEERQEYWDDVFDGGIPMSPEYARTVLWPKWGERLGIPKP